MFSLSEKYDLSLRFVWLIFQVSFEQKDNYHLYIINKIYNTSYGSWCINWLSTERMSVFLGVGVFDL